jgi:hypothetical protein
MQQKDALRNLDKLIAEFGGANDVARRSIGSCNFFLEHLQAARRNLLGSMPGEYIMSLRQARDSADCIHGKGTRAVIRDLLQTLIATEVPV